MTHEEKPAWQSAGIAIAESVPVEDEEVVRSEKKKEKKLRKKEVKRRRELLERFSLPTVPTPPGNKVPTPGSAESALPTAPPETPAAPSSRRAASWLRRASRGIAASEMVVAHKASVLIAVNCMMLSLSAFSVHRSIDQGRMWWAFLPLALTNVLSLIFALRSAQVSDERSTLTELTLMPQEDYQSALVSLVNDKERVVRTTAHETYVLRGDLTRRQSHLRTAINVLTGGVPISVLMFAFCFAMSSR